MLVEDDLAMPLRETRGLPTAGGHVPFQPFYVVTVLARLGHDGEWRSRPRGRGGRHRAHSGAEPVFAGHRGCRPFVEVAYSE